MVGYSERSRQTRCDQCWHIELFRSAAPRMLPSARPSRVFAMSLAPCTLAGGIEENESLRDGLDGIEQLYSLAGLIWTVLARPDASNLSVAAKMTGEGLFLRRRCRSFCEYLRPTTEVLDRRVAFESPKQRILGLSMKLGHPNPARLRNRRHPRRVGDPPSL
jgi:hypothetical protein